MKTIRKVITLTAILVVSILNAQEQQPVPEKPQLPKVKEYGIGLYNLNSFSLQYRWGNEKRLYRIQGNIGGRSTLAPSFTSSQPSSTSLNFNCGLSFSILKIKLISEKFGLMYGGIFGLEYSYSSNQFSNNTVDSKTVTEFLQSDIGFALGAVYKINSSFLIYAEIDPSIFYNYQQSTRTTIANIGNTFSCANSFGLQNLSNSGASLTIVYRITK